MIPAAQQQPVLPLESSVVRRVRVHVHAQVPLSYDCGLVSGIQHPLGKERFRQGQAPGFGSAED